MLDKGHYQTISQLKQASKAAGYHFFDRETMRFFGSVVYPYVRTGPDSWRFVTSERYQGEKRRYTVREIDTSGRIVTVGDFQQYPALADAIAAMEYPQG